MLGLTNIDLVKHVRKAYDECWAYMMGMHGDRADMNWLARKEKQCKSAITNFKDYLINNVINVDIFERDVNGAIVKKRGRIAVDCINLPKSLLWLTLGKYSDEIDNIKVDYNADDYYKVATIKGDMSTIQYIPGIILYKKGHAGILMYMNCEWCVVEAKGTKYGVVKTPLFGKGATKWTGWFRFPFYDYNTDKWIKPKGCGLSDFPGICDAIEATGRWTDVQLLVNGIYSSNHPYKDSWLKKMSV